MKIRNRKDLLQLLERDVELTKKDLDKFFKYAKQHSAYLNIFREGISYAL